MELKHYRQFYTLMVTRLLQKGKIKTGFALSHEEIQCIIKLFPKIDGVEKDVGLLGKFKQNF